MQPAAIRAQSLRPFPCRAQLMAAGLSLLAATPASAEPHDAVAVAPTTSPAASVSTDEQVTAAERARELGIGDRHAAVVILLADPKPEWVSAAAAADGGSTAAQKWLWPVVDGRVLRGVGMVGSVRGPAKTRRKRRHMHAGVDIGAPEGTQIRAAQSGLVIYSAHGVSGYGNLIVIVHADGATTMYAHCRKQLVRAGELVTRGQAIGEVGQTGLARGPHLHFEYRVGGDPRDPLPRFEPH